MKIIAGLGNPGKEYEHTRHNMGFDVIDELARRWHVTLEGGHEGGNRSDPGKRGKGAPGKAPDLYE